MKKHKFHLGWLAALFVCAGSATSPAQTADQPASNPGASAPAASSEQGESEAIVPMSAFEVTTTQGSGYVTTTAATAFKTDQPLMDIPQGDIVVTSDFIKDVGYENATDVLQYFGVMENIEGANMQMRGTSIISTPYLDEMPTGEYYQDESIVDSYEVVKGPAQTLYVGAGLAGVILETTKKPLPYNQDIVTGSIDQWGLFRVTLDSTGPLGRIGDFDFSYRMVVAYEHGNEYFYNTHDDHFSIFPELEFKYKRTTVRAYWNEQSVSGQPGMAFLTPTGQLETAMGWKGENQYSPENQPWRWRGRTIFVEILQKISDNWESRLSAMDWRYDLDTAYEYADYVDFDKNTETWGDLRGDEHWSNWTVLDDYQGHYQLGPDNWTMDQTDAFGFSYQSTTDKQFYFATAAFPWPNGTPGGLVTIPFNSPSALAAIGVAPPNDIGPPSTANWTAAGEANDIENQLTAIYWQHTMDLIPNWFTLITGWTWDWIATQSVSDWAILPWQGTNISLAQWVHRFGGVVHLTKAVSLYALDSTNFTSPGTAPPLQNGNEAPPELGRGTEIGLKWNFFNGKITGESAWFKEVTTNGLNLTAGTNNNGLYYSAVIGNLTEEGIDGDAAFAIVPGWQLIGSWYAGHEVDPFNHVVPSSFDNSLSIFSRYDFSKQGFLRGLSIGGGVSRTGGRWIASGPGVGQVSSTIDIPPVLKIQTGTLVNAFVSYQVNKHWGLRVSVANLLDEDYPVASESTVLYVDPSEPRDFTFSTSYKF